MRNSLCRWIGRLAFYLFAAPALVCAAALQPVPEATDLLVDQIGALSAAERKTLAARLKSIQTSGRAQVAILISGGTGGEPLGDYALRVAEKWQLGRAKRDDGLLILVIPSATAARIEVGYGLEGVIPDASASRWLDDLLSAMTKKELAAGLDELLDRVEGALSKVPQATVKNNGDLFKQHPKWAMPWVLSVFSAIALFPLFFGRWIGLASAPLLAGFLGTAAWLLWGPTAPTFAVVVVAFLLPFLWGLNWVTRKKAGPWIRYGRAIGNLMGIALFFCIISMFVGVGLWSVAPELVWAAPIFAGMFAIAFAIFLFPGKPREYLMLVMRSGMQFVLTLAVVYATLQAFMPHPTRVAFVTAAAITACAALGFYLASRERARASEGIRWSLWVFGLALLVTLPFGLLALALAVGGDDIQTRLVQAAAGGGSITAVLALAARVGLFAAVKIGLGGAFGGGGAGRG